MMMSTKTDNRVNGQTKLVTKQSGLSWWGGSAHSLRTENGALKKAAIATAAADRFIAGKRLWPSLAATFLTEWYDLNWLKMFRIVTLSMEHY